jgi:hypothetical protein
MSKDGQVARAKRDLAQALGIDEGQISLKSVKSTQWPDASLGKEEPNSFAAQVLIDGYIIDLQAKGRTYTYHADENSRVVRAW